MDRAVGRRGFLAAVGAASLAGCLGDAGAGPDEVETAGTTTADGESPPTAERSLPLPFPPADLRDMAVSGGPGKDGIPAIDDPSFEGPNAADQHLEPGAPVFGVAGETDVKAYPQSILVWHEVVNDAIDGRPVSVTYCPLTGTAMGFLRGGTTFGVSGRLFNNNLIMYDRATETWWPQVLATAIPGPWNESPETRSLREFRVVWTTWERWRERHPDTGVLSRETGYAKNYDVDPYGSYNPRRGYYGLGSEPLFRSYAEDERFDAKAVVLGARTAEGSVAFLKDSLRSASPMAGELDGVPHLAVYDADLDTGYVYRNPEGHEFDHRGADVVGADGTAHAPADLPLPRVLAFDAMWFAWNGFYPGSSVYD